MYIFDKNAAVGWASYHLRLLVLVLEVGHPEYIASRQQRLQQHSIENNSSINAAQRTQRIEQQRSDGGAVVVVVVVIWGGAWGLRTKLRATRGCEVELLYSGVTGTII